ncbi:MAG TPA: hypothetical protein VEV17_25505 [Bryobacteraceae bacterium]|nr:hypothetical protein [Bryobacteraceae bacterium]
MIRRTAPLYLFAVMIASLVVSLTAQSGSVPNNRPSASELTEAYRRGHDHRDLAALSKLFCWDRVTQEIKQVNEELMKSGFDEKIIRITVTTERPKGSLDGYLRNGVPYRFNLPVVAWLAVENPPLDKGSFRGTLLPLGIKDGRYLIALMAPAGPAAPQPNPSATAAQTQPGARSASVGPSQFLVVPAKTPLVVRLGADVGLKTIQAGGFFPATIAQPVVVDGVTIIPVGSPVQGIVAKSGAYSPYIELKSVTVNGTKYGIETAQSVFNETILFPAGSQRSFELLFALQLNGKAAKDPGKK